MMASHKGWYSNDPQAHEKMINLNEHQGNANKDTTRYPPEWPN